MLSTLRSAQLALVQAHKDAGLLAQKCAVQAGTELRLPPELAAVEGALREAYVGKTCQGLPRHAAASSLAL